MEDYNKAREELVKELTEAKYAGLTFSPVEEQANASYTDLLMKERATKNDLFFKGHTLRHKTDIQNNSRVYSALDKLPKGAVLHIHIDCCMDHDWVSPQFNRFLRIWKGGEGKQIIQKVTAIWEPQQRLFKEAIEPDAIHTPCKFEQETA